MPGRHYKKTNRYKMAVFINPKRTNFNLTIESKVIPRELLYITQPVLDEINEMINTSSNPALIVDFYDKSMEYIYEVLDMLINGDDINLIVQQMTHVKRYIDERLAKYNIYSEEYADSNVELYDVRQLLLSIIDNIMGTTTFTVADRRLEYLKEVLSTIRQDMNV